MPWRVWSGTALTVVGRLWGALCTLGILALASRTIPADAFGRFTFYLAAFALLDGLADFGTSAVAVQRSAHDPWAVTAVLKAGRRIRVGMASLGFGVVAVLVAAMGEPGGAWIALAALYPLTHALELSAIVHRNRLAWGVPVTARALAATGRLAVVAGLVAVGVESAALLLFATAAVSALANVGLHYASRPLLPRPTIAVRGDHGLFRAAVPMGVAMLCQLAYFYVDNLFVRAMEGLEEVGRYNAAMRVLGALIMVAQNGPMVALPWLARRGRSGDLGEAASNLLLVLWLPACAGIGLVGPWSAEVLGLLYGEPFEAAAGSLRWLLGAAAAIYAGACLLTALVAAGATRAVLAVAVLALAVNVAGNALLVPRLGAEGAAIATLVTEGVVALGAAWSLARRGVRLGGRTAAAAVAGPLLFGLAWWASAAVAP